MALAPYLANKELLAEAIVTTVVLGLLLLVGPYYAFFGRGRARTRSHTTATRGDPLRVECVRPGARLPERPNSRTLGYTLYSAEEGTVAPGRIVVVRTGLRISIPEGHVGLVVEPVAAGAFPDLHVAPTLLHPDSLQEVILAVANRSAEREAALEIGDPVAHLTMLCAAAPPVLVTTFDADGPRFVPAKRLMHLIWRLLKVRAHQIWLKALCWWKGPLSPPSFSPAQLAPPLPSSPSKRLAAEPTTSPIKEAVDNDADSQQPAPENEKESDLSGAQRPRNSSSSERSASPEVWRTGGRRRSKASTSLAAAMAADPTLSVPSPTSSTP